MPWRVKGSSAERTRGVREEPRVDTVDVEGVAANRKQPELIVLGEFAETDGAVERLFGAFDDVFVEEDRKGVDQSLV